MTWSTEALQRIDAAAELRIAVERADGTLRRALPIWVVSTGGHIYVRTWHRRETGWYGRAVSSGRARIQVPGLETDVTVEDIGNRSRAVVDAAYRAKYGDTGAGSMVTDAAAGTTLKLTPGSRAT